MIRINNEILEGPSLIFFREFCKISPNIEASLSSEIGLKVFLGQFYT